MRPAAYGYDWTLRSFISPPHCYRVSSRFYGLFHSSVPSSLPRLETPASVTFSFFGVADLSSDHHRLLLQNPSVPWSYLVPAFLLHVLPHPKNFLRHSLLMMNKMSLFRSYIEFGINSRSITGHPGSPGAGDELLSLCFSDLVRHDCLLSNLTLWHHPPLRAHCHLILSLCSLEYLVRPITRAAVTRVSGWAA